jgi:flavin-dependent dehydrogenase
MKVVIIGGGWSGCAAAISSKKAGADVTVIEKTDLLLGLGNVGGIMRNNGRYTASEELIALGGGELIEITDRVSTHTNIDFPGHKHATLYNVNMIEGEVHKYLTSLGINLMM